MSALRPERQNAPSILEGVQFAPATFKQCSESCMAHPYITVIDRAAEHDAMSVDSKFCGFVLPDDFLAHHSTPLLNGAIGSRHTVSRNCTQLLNSSHEGTGA